jgi:uncharacterized protein (TIGR02594 family)
MVRCGTDSEAHMATQDVPPWLEVMRSITGLHEYEDGSNPKIEGMAAFIGRVFPAQASYASGYTDDSIAWCGVATDFCLAACHPAISGPFGPTDTDKWMWAQSFASDAGFTRLSRPVPGAITVLTREGGGHVSMFEEWDDNGMLRLRGGNQSNSVNVSSYDPSTVVAYVWPTAFPIPDVPEVPVEDRPTLEEGDSGPDVIDLQTMIPHFTGEIDGDFGPTTKENVIRYQQSRNLEADGVVGQQTWQALYDEAPPVPQPVPPGALTIEQQQRIMQIANGSDIASYDWNDRGEAPKGWTQGMALAFAQSYKKLKAKHSALVEMSKPRTSSEKDVFNEYRDDFDELGMSNEEKDGSAADRLRHLYSLMLGHGMRESSGQHCCGRDQSVPPGYYGPADTTTEAGAFQTSYDAAGASNPEFDDLMDEYLRGDSPGYVEAFSEGVSCSSEDWASYGGGRGEQYQDLNKNQPAFSAENCGLTLRNLCNHYGPIGRHETELRGDAEDMFQDVQDYMDESDVGPVPPEPTHANRVDIKVNPKAKVKVEIAGDVYVTLNGEPYEPGSR